MPELLDQKAFVLVPELGEPVITMSTPELAREMDEVGSTKTDDLGLALPEGFDGGCLVWEGSVYSTDEDMAFGQGTWRAPSFDEVAAVIGGFSYWTDSDNDNENEDDEDETDADEDEGD